MTTTAHGAEEHEEHDHAHATHKFLAHHFDTPVQQFDSGKLGTWLFLTTEVLLFSGLFCAYSIYRANHPEIFEFAHQYLNKWLGALNTIVLIFSSFTMAWGVRAAQLGQRKFCVTLLAITIICGGAFMCVKYVEYTTKFREALYPGSHYNPTEMPYAIAEGEKKPAAAVAEPPKHSDVGIADVKSADAEKPAEAKAPAPTLMTTPAPAIVERDGVTVEQSSIPRAAAAPAGLNPVWVASEEARMNREKPMRQYEHMDEPNNAQIFFSIYFMMTGLHGIHVLAGMCLIGWVLFRANRGDFGPEYFSPVDFVGLYWHIVDLVWIFLFPLLYLIT